MSASTFSLCPHSVQNLPITNPTFLHLQSLPWADLNPILSLPLKPPLLQFFSLELWPCRGVYLSTFSPPESGHTFSNKNTFDPLPQNFQPLAKAPQTKIFPALPNQIPPNLSPQRTLQYHEISSPTASPIHQPDCDDEVWTEDREETQETPWAESKFLELRKNDFLLLGTRFLSLHGGMPELSCQRKFNGSLIDLDGSLLKVYHLRPNMEKGVMEDFKGSVNPIFVVPKSVVTFSQWYSDFCVSHGEVFVAQVHLYTMSILGNYLFGSNVLHISTQTAGCSNTQGPFVLNLTTSSNIPKFFPHLENNVHANLRANSLLQGENDGKWTAFCFELNIIHDEKLCLLNGQPKMFAYFMTKGKSSKNKRMVLMDPGG